MCGFGCDGAWHGISMDGKQRQDGWYGRGWSSVVHRSSYDDAVNE